MPVRTSQVQDTAARKMPAHVRAKNQRRSPEAVVDEDKGVVSEHFLVQLRALSPETSDERPAKRRRLPLGIDSHASDAEPGDQLADDCTIVIKRSGLLLTFPKVTSPRLKRPVHRSLVPYVITIDSPAPGRYHIKIYDKALKLRKLGQLLLDQTLHGRDIPLKDIELAIEVARDSVSINNPDGPGQLWTETSCEVGHENNVDYLRMDFVVKWNLTPSLAYVPARSTHRPALQRVMAEYFPESCEDVGKTSNLSPQEFYTSVHVPDQSDTYAAALAPQLDTNLYPFQKRSVRWLLNREGVDADANGQLVNLADVQRQFASTLPYSFREFMDSTGQKLYISHLFSLITRDVEAFRHVECLRGGILAEEMGLGKTVEVIALVSLHKRKLEDTATARIDSNFDPLIREHTRPITATLIITPPSILLQWITELNRHAPKLKVLHYRGINSFKSKMTESEISEKFAAHDIVLTTYNVLAAEIHYTVPPTDRSLRYDSKYQRPTSPLTTNQWWRVCLDEAQMIESGVSSAARVAKLIPRVNAWGISGTPLKKDIADLLGLLNFLRLEPYATLYYLWKRLISSHRESFKAIFGQLALRHTKVDVRNELRLPGQQRFVITVPFTPIEEQYYQSLYQGMCEDCGVDLQGGPLDENWDPEASSVIEKMRTWLVRLRQSALHPEIGGRNRRALGKKDGPLRTVDEVLDAMLEQSEIAIRAEQRTLLLSKLKRGQILENGPRVREALDIWTEVFHEISELVQESREQLQREIELTRSSSRVHSNSRDDTSTSSSEDEGTGTGTTAEHTRVGMLRNRLRNAVEIEHMAVFYRANAFFQIKSNEEMTKPDTPEFTNLEKQETESYESAKQLRREILQEILKKASRLMRKVSKKAASQAFVEIPEFADPKISGIESRRPLEQFQMLGAALDAQANQLDEWREKTIQYLLRPLVDEDEGVEITGDEYEESTKTQDEVMVYISALRAVIEDRFDALTGQDNILIKGDVRTALKLAKDGEGAFPEKVIELYKTRKAVKPTRDMSSLRGIFSELRSISTTLKTDAENGNSRAMHELSILEPERVKVQKQLTDQTKAVVALRQEVELFTSVMNARLEYYRQLQQVSDMVALLEERDKSQEAYDNMTKEEEKLENKLAMAVSKRRYLMHLHDEAGHSKEQRTCIICQETFEIGALTVCGHQFCKDCILLWRQQHPSCPVCKRKLKTQDLYDITYKPQQLKVAEESIQNSSERERSAGMIQSAIYSNISNNTLTQIQNVELDGPSYTTKIDTIARHLIWLRESDPGSKSIIFSQFKEFLDVLSRALTTYHIGHTSIAKPRGTERFKVDPGIECFLLHAKSQSSGLNLVNASHVFLCEPLINTALELQAIARVDRIGQRQKTSVYLYLIDGTVEENIYAISVRRRAEHMSMGRGGSAEQQQKQKAQGNEKEKPMTAELLDSNIEAANSLELQQAPLANLLTKGKAGGEVVDKTDLWDCLFRNKARNGAWGSKMHVVGQGGDEERRSERWRERERVVRGFLGAEAAETRANGTRS